VICYFIETTAFAKLFVKEPGTDALIRLMESLEDNRKLIAASAPLEVYAAIRKKERAGAISAQSAASALDILRIESARLVQEPLNPAVLESARQLLDRTGLRWTDALQLGAAMATRDMFPGNEIVFVSSMPVLIKAAEAEGFRTFDPSQQSAPTTES
jgi:predicted nucleic acid-binding protein